MKKFFLPLSLLSILAFANPNSRSWDEEIAASHKTWKMKVSEPREIVGPKAPLPKEVKINHSNNCVSMS